MGEWARFALIVGVWFLSLCMTAKLLSRTCKDPHMEELIRESQDLRLWGEDLMHRAEALRHEWEEILEEAACGRGE